MSAGARDTWVTFDRIQSVADGYGNYTEVYIPLNPPTVAALVEQATPRSLERLAAGSVVGVATLVVTIAFHPGVTLETRLRWIDRFGQSHTASVTGIVPAVKLGEIVLFCAETRA